MIMSVDKFLVLRSALQSACQPTDDLQIVEGRKKVLLLPRRWVLRHVEAAASACLDLDDDWEYRRLLELVTLLGRGNLLLTKLVERGLKHSNVHIVEASMDFAVSK
jgi:hypothetical protein